MKRKIVIKMQLNNEKDRRKAMQIASTTDGVTSVAIKGEAQDQVEVIGDEVDSVKLTRSLRKKFCGYAILVLVEEVKAAKGEGKKEEKKQDPIQCPCSSYYQNPPIYMVEVVDHNPNPPSCSIL